MKSSEKSSVINYEHLYSILTLGFTLFFLYIVINFFLPIANFISIFFLTLSIFILLLYFFTKSHIQLTLSLACCLTSLAISLMFHYLMH